MKSDYKVRAIKFIKQIAPFFEDCLSPYDYENAVKEFNRKYNRKVICANGVSRIAFITSDYVIKIDYNERCVAYAGGCEDEVQFYQFAKNCGFEYLFAAIEKVVVGGRDYFIMPRINGVGKFSSCYANEYLCGDDLEFIENYLGDLHNENFGWKNHHVVIIDYAWNQFRSDKSYD